MPITMAWSCRAISTCRKTPKRRRRWSRSSGGWIAGVRGAFQYWGPYLAARGIAVFAISYRLATKTKTFPEAVQDVLAAVQFARGKASAFGIDPARIGLIGASAGAHLAALAALSGKKFLGAYPQDPFAAADTSVKALVGGLRHARDVVFAAGAG